MSDDLFESLKQLAFKEGSSVASLLCDAARKTYGLNDSPEALVDPTAGADYLRERRVAKALKRCPAFAYEITKALHVDEFVTPEGRPSRLLHSRIYSPTLREREDFEVLFQDALAHIAANKEIPWLTRDY